MAAGRLFLRYESKNHFNEILKQGKFIVIGKNKESTVALGVKSVIRSFNNSDALIQYLIRNKKYLMCN